MLASIETRIVHGRYRRTKRKGEVESGSKFFGVNQFVAERGRGNERKNSLIRHSSAGRSQRG